MWRRELRGLKGLARSSCASKWRWPSEVTSSAAPLCLLVPIRAYGAAFEWSKAKSMEICWSSPGAKKHIQHLQPRIRSSHVEIRSRAARRAARTLVRRCNELFDASRLKLSVVGRDVGRDVALGTPFAKAGALFLAPIEMFKGPK